MEFTTVEKGNWEYFQPFIGNDPEAGVGVIGAIEDDMPIGAAAFEIRDNSAIMTQILISEDYRGRGAGKGILGLAKRAFATAGIRDFMVFYTDKEDITGFLTMEGFRCTQTDPLYSCSMQGAVDSKNVKMLLGKCKGDSIIACKDLVIAEREKGQLLLKRHRFDSSVYENGAYDENLSFAYKRGGEVKGLIMAMTEGDDVYVTALVTTGEDKKVPTELIAAFVRAVTERKLTGGKLYFLARNRKFAMNINTFLDKGAQLERVESAWTAHFRFQDAEEEEEML